VIESRLSRPLLLVGRPIVDELMMMTSAPKHGHIPVNQSQSLPRPTLSKEETSKQLSQEVKKSYVTFLIIDNVKSKFKLRCRRERDFHITRGITMATITIRRRAVFRKLDLFFHVAHDTLVQEIFDNAIYHVKPIPAGISHILIAVLGAQLL